MERDVDYLGRYRAISAKLKKYGMFLDLFCICFIFYIIYSIKLAVGVAVKCFVFAITRSKICQDCQVSSFFLITNALLIRTSSYLKFGSSTTHPKFDPTGVQTHDLQIMTIHFMTLKCLL